MLKIRLSVMLEDLTLHVAQSADKEREATTKQLVETMDAVKSQLSGMEERVSGFQRTMHLVVGEVDADKERTDAIQARGPRVIDPVMMEHQLCEISSH